MGVVPTDGVEHLSSHFSEAFTYTKNWLISFLCVSIIASIFIDQIISFWINSFTYGSNELTIYSPNRWLRMRWGTVLLTGLLFSIPYGSYLLNRFIKPGLFHNEQIIIQLFIIFSTIMLSFFVPLCWYFIAPSIISDLSYHTQIQSITERYDISIIYTIVLGLTWAFVISILSITAQAVSFVLFDKENLESNPTKWKIHMFTLFFLYLVLLGPLSPLWLPLSIIIILVTHLIHGIFPIKNIALIQHGYQTMNQDGSINRVAILDCDCEDSCPKLNNPPPNAAVIRSKSICLNPESNERLVQILNSNNYTKLVITGCNGKPIPKITTNFLDSKSIKIVGLSWLDQRGSHPEDIEMINLRKSIEINDVCGNDFYFDSSKIIEEPGWGRYIPRGNISLPQYGEN
ncbi:MAG: hypothetical protein CMB31_05920 [Euryarchaeota archaeon]|nr:hypothetical protein [Euryarchaeota archaeon]